MKLNLTDTLYALSFALDTVQYEMGGISNKHGKHVAFISYLIGNYLKYDNDKLNDLVGLAILHDNAFTEYVREEYNNGELFDYDDLTGDKKENLASGFLTAPRHNIVGEQNIRLIPFNTNVEKVILYHHENADGSGPLHKKADETNEMAQIIHIADMMDVLARLELISEEEFNALINKIKASENKMFSPKMVNALVNSINYELIKVIQNDEVIPYLKNHLKSEMKEYSDRDIKKICSFFANIIDYKSSITKNHSLGVASKCEAMAKYYGLDKEKTIRLYFAGAFHDIGKLIINNDILEKPGKLTKEEFEVVKNHADATSKILSMIEGIDDIAIWAKRHHERLDGTGYLHEIRDSDLSFEDRLLACMDIYQALTEKRSYKDEYSHDEAIKIMMDMANDNKIDMNIVLDTDKCFKNK